MLGMLWLVVASGCSGSVRTVGAPQALGASIAPRPPHRLAIGAGFVCVLRAGRVRCGGDVPWLASPSATFVDVSFGEDLAEIVASDQTLCARTVSGDVVCRVGEAEEPTRWDRGDVRRVALHGDDLVVSRGDAALEWLPMDSPERSGGVQELEAGSDLVVGAGVACGLDDRGGVRCLDQFEEVRLEAQGPNASIAFDASELELRSTDGTVIEYDVLDFARGFRPSVLPRDARWIGGGCAVVGEGTVSCPHRAERAWTQIPTVTIEGVRVLEVARDFGTACVLDDRDRVLCWGDDDGALQIPRVEPVRSEVLGVTRAVAVEIAYRSEGDHACALTETGDVWCWGAWYGARPRRMDGLAAMLGAQAVEIASSPTTDCARGANRRVACWGTRRARIEDLSDEPVILPMTLIEQTNVDELDACGSDICVRSDARVTCWGEEAARAIAALEGASSIAGAGEHVCGVVHDVLRCAPLVEFEEGDEWTPTEPRSVGSIDALRGGGTLCWRARGTWRCARAGVEIPAGTIDVWSGGYRICAIDGDGRVACTGVDAAGLMARDADSAELVDQDWLGPARSVSLSLNLGCAIGETGRVHCWGPTRSPALGDGQSVDWAEPRVVDE